MIRFYVIWQSVFGLLLLDNEIYLKFILPLANKKFKTVGQVRNVKMVLSNLLTAFHVDFICKTSTGLGTWQESLERYWTHRTHINCTPNANRTPERSSLLSTVWTSLFSHHYFWEVFIFLRVYELINDWSGKAALHRTTLGHKTTILTRVLTTNRGTSFTISQQNEQRPCLIKILNFI